MGRPRAPGAIREHKADQCSKAKECAQCKNDFYFISLNKLILEYIYSDITTRRVLCDILLL